MDLQLKNEMVSVPDLRHRLRQLRWFRATFRKHAAIITQIYGVRFEIDETRLTRAFLNWIEVVNHNKSFSRIDRRDFIVFAAGLVLRELMIETPAKALNAPASVSGDAVRLQDIVAFWPEGFLYTNYCICAIAAIQEQEFGVAPPIDKCADELRTWWSYRENVREMPDYAIAFLDKFLGNEPNWVMPDLASARSAVKRALGSGNPSDAIRHSSKL